jgi:predicted CXXCH cytochrome family protein
VERQAGEFAGYRFSHAPHLLAAKLDCSSCHRPHPERAPGEVVRFGQDGCMPCHHRSSRVEAPECASCHGDVRAHTVSSWRGEFSHKAHQEAGAECGMCHQPRNGDPRTQKATCLQCHVEG